MPVDLSKSLVIAISSRALFDLEESNIVFETHGEAAYVEYQKEREDEILKPGTGFRLIKAILGLNEKVRGGVKNGRRAEVVVMSRNSPATSLRLFNSIEHYGLDIQRSALTSGTPVTNYLSAFSVNLYLSAHENDVREASQAGIAAGLIYGTPEDLADPCEELRIAFDGDNVLFGGESENIFQTKGLDAFIEHEKNNAHRPMEDGPFAKFFRTLVVLQKDRSFDKPPIRTALITARNMPAHKRVIYTFREWGIHVDEAFFMGGVSKTEILKQFRPHIFFDDQESHCTSASPHISTARVLPVELGSPQVERQPISETTQPC